MRVTMTSLKVTRTACASGSLLPETANMAISPFRCQEALTRVQASCLIGKCVDSDVKTDIGCAPNFSRFSIYHFCQLYYCPNKHARRDPAHCQAPGNARPADRVHSYGTGSVAVARMSKVVIVST